MNYAQTYNIGNHQNTRPRAATKITPSVKPIRKLDAKAQGCKRSIERQTKIRTDSDVTNSFLKCTFLPKLKQHDSIQQTNKEKSRTERDFYKSLSQLAKHYNITPLHTEHLGYPYNIALAISDLEHKLKSAVMDWEEIVLLQDGKKTYFVSQERYDTSSTLFFIPVFPLYRIMRSKKRKRNAPLLLSVFAYLYHIAGIPHYRQDESYLCWVHERITEWVEHDDLNEETKLKISELKQAEFIGEVMEKRIYNPINISLFKERTENFKPKDEFETNCLEIAKEAFAIFQKYPNERIFRNATPNGEISDEDMEEVISMEKYISFYADHSGWLNETIIEFVNTDIQEYGVMEEPIVRKKFNGKDIAGNNLCFENRLFELLHNLTDILNEC